MELLTKSLLLQSNTDNVFMDTYLSIEEVLPTSMTSLCILRKQKSLSSHIQCDKIHAVMQNY